MPVPQITVRLTPALKQEFESYSDRLGIGASKATKLLIERELRLKRLLKLTGVEALPRQKPRHFGANLRLPTITAHVSTLKSVRDFDGYARRCGVSRSRAGAWVLETELQERWLARRLQDIDD